MRNFLLVFHLLLTLIMIGVILIQRGEDASASGSGQCRSTHSQSRRGDRSSGVAFQPQHVMHEQAGRAQQSRLVRRAREADEDHTAEGARGATRKRGERARTQRVRHEL